MIRKVVNVSYRKTPLNFSNNSVSQYVVCILVLVSEYKIEIALIMTSAEVFHGIPYDSRIFSIIFLSILTEAFLNCFQIMIFDSFNKSSYNQIMGCGRSPSSKNHFDLDVAKGRCISYFFQISRIRYRYYVAYSSWVFLEKFRHVLLY